MNAKATEKRHGGGMVIYHFGIAALLHAQAQFQRNIFRLKENLNSAWFIHECEVSLLEKLTT